MLEMAGSGLREVADPARAFLGAGARRRAGRRPSRRRSRAAGRCSSRSRRSSRRPGFGAPRRTASRHRDATDWPCSWPCSAAGPAWTWRPGHLRQPRRRPERRRAGPRPAARPRPRLRVPRSAGRPGTVADAARSACSASCGRSSGLERRLREAARLGFARADRPGRQRAAAIGDARRGPRDRGACRRCATRSGPPSDRPVRCSLRDQADLARADACARLAGPSMTRLRSAARRAWLGLLHRLPRPRTRSTAFVELGGRRLLLPPGSVAWSVVGFSVLPYITVVPARWLHPARQRAVDRRVRRRPSRA